MGTNRPINLDLWRLKFPVMAIASILHRISGIVIFLSLPFLMYLFHKSLLPLDNIDAGVNFINPLMKFLLWGSLTAVFYHLFAGIRHLAMDLGYGESLTAGRSTAKFIIILAVIMSILSGVWLWQV